MNLPALKPDREDKVIEVHTNMQYGDLEADEAALAGLDPQSLEARRRKLLIQLKLKVSPTRLSRV